jgi:hypothetical protein
MRADVKPLTHWIIYQGYRVRFTARRAEAVTGVLTTPAGEIEFRYDPARRVIYLPEAAITVNEYGWEVARQEDARNGR